MNKKKRKEAFNHDIDTELIEQFNILFEQLPGRRYEIVEAALRCFLSLPKEQQIIWMLSPDVRKMINPNLISQKSEQTAVENDNAAHEVSKLTRKRDRVKKKSESE